MQKHCSGFKMLEDYQNSFDINFFSALSMKCCISNKDWVWPILVSTPKQLVTLSNQNCFRFPIVNFENLKKKSTNLWKNYRLKFEQTMRKGKDEYHSTCISVMILNVNSLLLCHVTITSLGNYLQNSNK